MTRRSPSAARSLPTLEPMERRALLSAAIDVLGGAAALTIRAGQTVHANGLNSDVSADADGDPSTGPGTPLTARYQWDFGDPTVPTAATPVPISLPPVALPPDATRPVTNLPAGNEGVGPVADEAVDVIGPVDPPVPQAVSAAAVPVRAVPVRAVREAAVPVAVRQSAFTVAPQAVLGGQFNTLDGFNAAHVYERPGTFALKLTVTDQSGTVSTDTRQVVVLPDDRPIIYVAQTGAADGDGASPFAPVSFDGLRRLLASGPDESDTRILLRRGDLFEITAPVRLDGLHDLTIGAYGVGAKPVVRYVGAPASITPLFGMNTLTSNLTIRDLSIESRFGGFDKNGVPDAVQPRGTNITVLDNDFHNVSYAVNTNLKPDGVLVQGNRAPGLGDLRAYFVWLGGSDIVITGNQVANSSREHVVRGAGWERRAGGAQRPDQHRGRPRRHRQGARSSSSRASTPTPPTTW